MDKNTKENKVNNRFNMRLSDEDLQKLEDLRTETGMNNSEIMRKALSKYHLSEIFDIR